MLMIGLCSAIAVTLMSRWHWYGTGNDFCPSVFGNNNLYIPQPYSFDDPNARVYHSVAAFTDRRRENYSRPFEEHGCFHH